MFLFSKSNFFIPEYSILIRCSPIKPKIKGNIKLIDPGKKEVKLILKNEFNLEDFKVQLSQIHQMGNVNEIINMIPGINGKIKNKFRKKIIQTYFIRTI